MGESAAKEERLLFRHPPVVELALGVQFKPLPGFHSAHLGLFWNTVRDRYPSFDERAPLDPARETFEPVVRQGFQIQVSQSPLLRGWFLSAGGDRLVQVQQDRFVLNWRRTDADATYPSFDKCLEDFVAEFEGFRSFVGEEQCGPLIPEQCEVTYVDQIDPGNVWKQHGRVGCVFRIWKDPEDGPEPEDVEFSVRHRIVDGKGRPLGRVHTHLRPKWRMADRQPILELRLTARGAPVSDRVEGVADFLRLGHDRTREIFLWLTTEEIQKEWGRLDESRRRPAE